MCPQKNLSTDSERSRRALSGMGYCLTLLRAGSRVIAPLTLPANWQNCFGAAQLEIGFSEVPDNILFRVLLDELYRMVCGVVHEFHRCGRNSRSSNCQRSPRLATLFASVMFGGYVARVWFCFWRVLCFASEVAPLPSCEALACSVACSVARFHPTHRLRRMQGKYLRVRRRYRFFRLFSHVP